MKYQEYEVNFSQPTTAQFNALIQAVGQTNYQVAKNSDNLIKMGKDMTKIGQDNTYFGNAITNLDNAVRQIISQGTGSGMTRQQVENTIENYHGDDIALLYRNHAEQENRITDGFNARKQIDMKIEKMFNDHDKFYSTLGELGKTDTELGKTDTILGNKLIEAKKERDRIEALIDNGKDCGFLGINCIFDNLLPNVSSTALLAGAGVAAYLLLGKKL